MKNNGKILGIMGGMGSQASVFLYNLIIDKSPAQTDNENIEIFIHNNSAIPDRTEAISYFGKDPFPEMLRSARILDQLRADYIIIACVTAHYYAERLQQELKYSKILNLFHIIPAYLKVNFPDAESFGILGTTGLVKTGLWDAALESINARPSYLPPNLQENLFMEAVYGADGVKSGIKSMSPKIKLVKACKEFEQSGVNVVLSSCSEVPLALTNQDVDITLVDIFDVLVDHTLSYYYTVVECEEFVL